MSELQTISNNFNTNSTIMNAFLQILIHTPYFLAVFPSNTIHSKTFYSGAFQNYKTNLRHNEPTFFNTLIWNSCNFICILIIHREFHFINSGTQLIT